MGVDSISPRVLSLSAPAIEKEVVKFINKFIEKRDWILELKRTNVSPIFKNNNATDKKNYRPVSLFCFVFFFIFLHKHYYIYTNKILLQVHKIHFLLYINNG